MRLLVCGNRDWTDHELIRDTLVEIQRESVLQPEQITLIHGDSRGLDRIAGSVARELGWHVIAVPAEWDRYRPKKKGRKNPAGNIRNRRMVNEFKPTHGIAFGDLEREGMQTGTGDCVKVMEAAGIKPKLVEWRNR